MSEITILKFLAELPRIIQNSFFEADPYSGPSEDVFQEILRFNLFYNSRILLLILSILSKRKAEISQEG